ncbi:ABC transporter substrate-binding protein [Devosia ginsengisoli]|uniref:ABC transporter substrate-binding protein n=1 Tax=Devosia ginsengisoli TaxID=400770 RepID=A0A5B8LQC1_9HYPH|nr:ABC transporter substrate-binding protein [Devosia ginsengisoli]QDZ10149.1 ABC transporter substrate-binding protein [Devosia ginsengisoli]
MFVASHVRPVLALVGSVALCLSPMAAGAVETGSAQCGDYSAPAFPALAPIAAAEGSTTVVSEFGDVELPTAPGAALGMYTTDVDILIWLGYPLTNSQPIRGDSGYQTFPCFFPPEPLKGITTFGNYPEYSYEQILRAEPDFILNGLGYDEAVNERLPQIAPTYSVNAFDGRSWQAHFRETAEALGRLDRYDAWLDIYESRLAEVKAAIGDNAGAVVAPLSYWDGSFNASCYAGVECTVFRDLGLTIYEGALADGGNGVSLGAEQAGELAGIDYIFTTVGVGETGMTEHEERMADAARNPVWAQLDVVRNGHIVPFEMEMVYGSPSGQLAFLKVVAKALSQ